jgi:hypothetical protein
VAQTIFSSELDEFCQKYLVVHPGPDPSRSEIDSGFRHIHKLLFENLLLFDKLSIKITRESIAVPVLIGALGQKGFDALIEQEAIEFVLWSHSTGFVVKNVPGLDGLVTFLTPPEFADPEKSIEAGLRWMPAAPQGRQRRKLIKRLVPLFRTTDNDISTASLNVVRAALQKGELAHYGLPIVTGHADNLSESEKRTAMQCANQLAEYRYILGQGMTSFSDYRYYSPFWATAARFQTMNRSMEAFSRVGTLEGLPDLKALFDEIRDPLVKLPRLRQSRNARAFRRWLEETAGDSPDTDMVESYLAAISEKKGGLFDTAGRKLVKAVGMAAVGVGSASLAAHFVGEAVGATAGAAIALAAEKGAEFVSETAMGLLDNFVLEAVAQGRSPKMFLDDLSQLRQPAPRA